MSEKPEQKPDQVAAPPEQVKSPPDQKSNPTTQPEDDEFVNRKREDAKSVFVQNVDYKASKEELQIIFEDCGPVTRVTILKDHRTNQPKGCAYVAFQDQASVDNAIYLTGTRLRNRAIKVQHKRTNIAGMGKIFDPERNFRAFSEIAQFYGRGRGRGR